jgi:(heptosyl)LPS beta-1,4-glucosyltransferase
MNNISAVIVVKGSPSHLFEAVASIHDIVQEIIVADIGMSASIFPRFKENKKIKIVPIKKAVPYVEVIREELKKYASCDYVLFIDPDEILGEPLKQLLSAVYKKYNYIKIPRKNIIFGKWIEHSRWWPDYQVRLFKKDAVKWQKKIHSQPKIIGSGFTVEAKEEFALIHYNYETVDEFMQKFVRYAKAEASQLSSFSLSEALQKALSEFMSRYFAEKGYKDGVHGFILAFLQMFYYFLVYVYHWELKNKPSINSQEFIETTQLFFRQGLKENGYWMIKEKLMKGKDLIIHKIIGKLLS